jgi:hypothetical protein
MKVKKSKKSDSNSEVALIYTDICELCKGRMIKVGGKIIGGSKFNILKCEKCKHTIARTFDVK